MRRRIFIILVGLTVLLAMGSLSASSDFDDLDSAGICDNASAIDCDVVSSSSSSANNLAVNENYSDENILESFNINESLSSYEQEDNYDDFSYDFNEDFYDDEEVKLKLVSKSSFLYKSGGKVKISSGLVYDSAYATIKYQYDNKHYKTFKAYDDVNSLWYIPVKKFKTTGKHKIIVKCDGKKLVKYITIKKRKLLIKAKSKKVKYHKNRYLKIKIKDKHNKNALKNKKVYIKVSGHTYKARTNKKGIAKFNTKRLSSGKHKVKIVVKLANYRKATKKVYITVKKPKAKKKKSSYYGSGYSSSHSSSGSFVASANSNKFHYSGCTWAQKIRSYNLIHFSSRSQAINAGYSPCYYCSP